MKGYALLSYLSALDGRPALQGRVLSALQRDAPETHGLVLGQVFAHEWYPRAHLHAFLGAVAGASANPEEDLRALGARAAEFQIGRIYRVFVAFASPAMVFQRAGSIWSRQSSAGTFTVLEDHPDHLIGELNDPKVPPQLPVVMAGWSDRVVSMLRRRPLRTEISAVDPGRWRFRVAWA
jgi:hypothetical protein